MTGINSLYVIYADLFGVFVSLLLLYASWNSLLIYPSVMIVLTQIYFVIPSRPIRDASKLKAVIVGGGFSGLNVAVKLQEVGIDFVILEKAQGLGGTWHDNRYPGAACDVPSPLYSFSFYPNPWWTKKFSPWYEIRHYLEDVASHFRLYPHFRFGKQVSSAEWDEASHTWIVITSDGEEFTGNFLFQCTGELHVPNIPEFKGMTEFHGEMFHTARWRRDTTFDRSKTVAIIGTGASAVQLIPKLAEKVKDLYIFQRTPVWSPPIQKYKYPFLVKLAFAICPPILVIHRWFFFWFHEFIFYPMFDRTKKKDTIKSIGQSLAEYVRKVVKDPEIAEKLIPKYEFGCKRISASDNYLQTFNEPNVHLITDKIHRFTSTGIKTSSGEEVNLDKIILATGFDLDKSYKAFRTIGRHGKVMQEDWDDTPNAYKGTQFPNMPNMFIILGPNTNLLHNSRIFMIECQVEYAIKCIRKMTSVGSKVIDVKPAAFQSYNTKLQKSMKEKVYFSGCNSYYKNSKGTIISLWPGDCVRFWWITRRCQEADFVFK